MQPANVPRTADTLLPLPFRPPPTRMQTLWSRHRFSRHQRGCHFDRCRSRLPSSVLLYPKRKNRYFGRRQNVAAHALVYSFPNQKQRLVISTEANHVFVIGAAKKSASRPPVSLRQHRAFAFASPLAKTAQIPHPSQHRVLAFCLPWPKTLARPSGTQNPPEVLRQCGLNVLPVSIRVFSRERIRGQPSAVPA